MSTPSSTPSGPALAADCSRCFGLCCVLLPFSASSGFGADKASGDPCHHLRSDDGCEIHAGLREQGWPGCATFDCFGAGQQVSQVTYGGVSWRRQEDLGEMAAALSVMRQLHEMLFHLAEVEARAPDDEASALQDQVLGLTAVTPVELLALDVDELRHRIGEVLRSASRRLRSGLVARELGGADLAGRDLRSDELAGADLRGAVLIGADLRSLRLGPADLLGADLRGAALHGTDLAQVLFLTQPQVNAARGDGSTLLPARLTRPAHYL